MELGLAGVDHGIGGGLAGMEWQGVQEQRVMIQVVACARPLM